MNEIGQTSGAVARTTTPVVIILSGPSRGKSEPLTQNTYRLLSDLEEHVRLIEPDPELEVTTNTARTRTRDRLPCNTTQD